jgi:hypothetical protein
MSVLEILSQWHVCQKILENGKFNELHYDWDVHQGCSIENNIQHDLACLTLRIKSFAKQDKAFFAMISF